jgi:hypothetical protein
MDRIKVDMKSVPPLFFFILSILFIPAKVRLELLLFHVTNTSGASRPMRLNYAFLLQRIGLNNSRRPQGFRCTP